MRKLGLILLFLGVCFGVALTSAQGRVRAVVTNEVANIRVIPNFGGEPLGQVPAGYFYDINARDASGEWYRFDFNGSEGWIHYSTSSVVEGTPDTLPVADPRTIPYGGFESPRSGTTGNMGGTPATARDWLRVRSGPSTGYIVLANVPINETMNMLGRTPANNWIQVNYQGALGWVSAEWLIVPAGFQIANLPIDGIVADAPPAGDGGLDYFNTLRFMRDRLDLAQPSLDTIRTYWTDAALTGRASCQDYPAQPSDLQIPQPLLAAYFTTLDPLRTEFNDTMYNLRYAIQLFIDACNQPGTVNPVGQATIQGALGVVSLADRQFIDLRAQLDALIPPPDQPGPNDCIFTFGGTADILPVLAYGQLVIQQFTPRKFAVGFCFDATEGQSLIFETAQKAGATTTQLITVSPINNPTEFLAVGRGSSPESVIRLGPVTIPRTGRYLLIVAVSDIIESTYPQSEFGVLITSSGGPTLTIDPVTGEIVIPIIIPLIPGLTPGAPSPTGVIVIPPASSNGGVSNVCPNITASCSQLSTCEQAQSCLQLGNFSLDDDGDGIPCEQTLCGTFP